MFLESRVWVGALLGVALLGLATGCNDKVKAERDSLSQQNQELKTALAAEKQATADAQTKAQAAEAALAAANAQPKPPEVPPMGPEGPIVGGGSPRGRATPPAGREQRFEIAGDVLFDSGKSTLKASAKAELKKLVASLKSAQQIRVEGYTDSVPRKKGTNEELSLARANSVKAYLVSQGIPTAHITTKGLGATKFKDAAHPTAAVNRRVEIVIVK